MIAQMTRAILFAIATVARCDALVIIYRVAVIMEHWWTAFAAEC